MMEPQQPNNNQQYPAPNTPATPTDNQSQFTPTEPPKGKKTGLMVASIVAVLVILGVVAFALMNSGKKDNTNKSTGTSNTDSSSKQDTANSDKFQKYDVDDKMTGAKYSVSFYKNATVSEKNGRTFLLAGETGSQYSVNLGVADGGTIDCGNSPSTTMTLNGESTKVCYDSSNKHYAGYLKVGGNTVQLNLAAQKTGISMEDAKAIMESVKIN